MERFGDKVAIVTGAASGVGRATAQRLASEGASIYGIDVSEEALAETADLVTKDGGRIATGVHDLSSRDACHAAVAAAVDAFGRLDVVGNIAGVSRFHVFEELTEEQWDFVMGVNLKGVAERHGKDALGFVSSSRCTMEENYLVQKLSRAVFGTNNVHQCAAT